MTIMTHVCQECFRSRAITGTTACQAHFRSRVAIVTDIFARQMSPWVKVTTNGNHWYVQVLTLALTAQIRQATMEFGLLKLIKQYDKCTLTKNRFAFLRMLLEKASVSNGYGKLQALLSSALFRRKVIYRHCFAKPRFSRRYFFLS